jgi:hypothetical protein
LVIDGESFELASARGQRPKPDEGAPDLVITGPARALIATRRGETTLADEIANGALTVAGSKRALRNFQTRLIGTG